MQEQQLIKSCLDGSAKAQKALYDQYAAQMLGICYRYTKSMDDANDVLQEGFIRVFNFLHQFNGECALGGWIRTIMVRASLNYIKKNKKYQQELSFDEMPLHPIDNITPEVLMNKKEIANLIRQLPIGYQTIFNMYAIEGFSHVEIAEMLGINEGTSRSQYSRARQLLASWILKKTDIVKKEIFDIKRVVDYGK